MPINVLGISGISPELKTFYSKHLLDRLVPALVHADHGILEEVYANAPYDPEIEMKLAIRKWNDYFDGKIRKEGTSTPALG